MRYLATLSELDQVVSAGADLRGDALYVSWDLLRVLDDTDFRRVVALARATGASLYAHTLLGPYRIPTGSA